MAVRRISSPLTNDVVKGLKTGDAILLSGTIITARDQAHKYLCSGANPPVDLTGMVIYHCGPVAREREEIWKIIAAGPTTSIREEPYEAEIIRRFRPAAIMGKGGMGKQTLKAMEECGCVYLHVTGGAAQYLAKCIKEVKGVFMQDEFGQPEAMWLFRIEDMPALVTMDTYGSSFHAERELASFQKFKALLNRKFESMK
jgi:fumarate hydratase class I